MGLLNSFDAIVIVGYLVSIATVGVCFYRRTSGLDSYLVGGRMMKWLPVGLSILASDTSALTYLGYAAWTYQHDLKYNQVIFPQLLAIPIVIGVFLPVYSKGNLYTAYQYLEHRFDLRLRLLGSVLFMAIRGAHVAIIIFAPALVIAALMGIPLKLSILVVGLLTAFYTSLGGIKSVIWTDAIQVGMVFVGFSTLAISALSSIHGGLPSVWAIGMAHGKFKLFDFSVNFREVDNFWALMIGGTLVQVQAMSTDQAVLQKYFTTRSERETVKSLIFYGAVSMPLVCALSALGIILFAFYQQNPQMAASLHNPEAVVAYYGAQMLPHGLAGLFVASIFAGSMSTVSASLNSLATSSVVDVYQRLIYKRGSDRHYTNASRIATFLWGGAATVVAFYAGRLGSLIIAFPKVQCLFGGIIVGIFVLGISSRRISATAAFLGAILGLAVVAYFSAETSVSLYWHVVIGVLATLVFGWLLSLVLPPKVPEPAPQLSEDTTTVGKPYPF